MAPPVWLDPADVRKWLRDNAQPPANDAVELDRVCSGTERHVERVRSDMWDPYPPWEVPEDDQTIPVFIPDDEVEQGAIMYAARWLRRRNTPTGVEFGEAGAVFSPRFDPQIDQALHTRIYTHPRVG